MRPSFAECGGAAFSCEGQALLRCGDFGFGQETVLGKRVTRTRFQVALERCGELVVVEADRDFDLPGIEFRCVWGFAVVVFFETVFQVIGQSNICLT